MKSNKQNDLESVSAVSIVFKATGFDPSQDVPVIIALSRFNITKDSIEEEDILELIVSPEEVRFKPEAKAAFGLDHKAVREITIEGISQESAKKIVLDFVGNSPLVAHGLTNVSNFFPDLVKDRLCIDNLRLSRHVWAPGTEIGGFKLETHKVYELSYWLNLNPDLNGAEPTTSKAEALVTASVCKAAIKDCQNKFGFKTWEEIEQKAQSFIPIKTYPIGRLKGLPLSSLQDYDLQREMSQERVMNDKDLFHALEEERERRALDKKNQIAQKSFFAKGRLCK